MGDLPVAGPDLEDAQRTLELLSLDPVQDARRGQGVREETGAELAALEPERDGGADRGLGNTREEAIR